jgi:sugar lactone lactonase YvrE
MVAEQVTDAVAYHAEGPVWSERWGGLRWVDMLAGDVLSLAAEGSVERRHVASVVAALRPRRGGGAVLGIERGFALEDAGGTITRLSELWTEARLRMNEGACDPDGRFYCGSMAYDKQPGAGTLYRLDPDGSVAVTLRGVTISNGLQWSAVGNTVFYNDTPTGRVDRFAFDPDTAAFTERRTFAEVTGDGSPDGMAIDEEDGVWVALWGGGAVHRYDSAGRLDLVVELPVSNVTACAFGGPDRRTLFITTSREGLEPSDQPDAGAVFRYEAGVRGAPQHAYAG